MRRKLWRICPAFLVAILALISVHAEETEQVGTPPSIVAGQEEQHGTAHPASADGSIPAVPYQVNVSDWFESDTEMTYKWERIQLTIDGVDEYNPDKKERIDLELDSAMLTPVFSATKQVYPPNQVYDPNVVYNIKLDTVTGELIYKPKITEVGKTVTFYVRAKNEFGYSKMITLSIHVEKTVNAKNAELTIVKDKYQPISNNMFYQDKVAFLAKIRTNGNEIVKVLLNEKQLISRYVTFSDYKYDSETGDLSIYGSACKELTHGEHTVTIIMSGGEDLSFPVTIADKNSGRKCSVAIKGFGPPSVDGTITIIRFEQVTCPYGETIALGDCADTKYYRFAGWWSNSTDPEGPKRYTSETPITHDIGLSIKWELIEYTVRFLMDEEKVYMDYILLPDEIIMIPEPPRTGYQFMGWYTEPNGQGEQLKNGTVVTGDADYYAYWRKGSIGCGSAGGAGGWGGTTPSESTEPPETPSKKKKTSGGKRDYVSWGAKSQEQNNTDTEKEDTPITETQISANKEPFMNGYSDGTFRPEQALLGADAESVLEKLANVKTGLSDSEISFNDISANMTVTRGDFCVALAKALNILPAKGRTGDFRDLSNNTNTEYICALEDMGIIKGYGDDTFRPKQNITRAETAAVISRAIKRTDLQPGETSRFSDVLPTDWYYTDVMNVCAYME